MKATENSQPVRQIIAAGERWPLARSFAISRGAKTEAHVLLLSITVPNPAGGAPLCGRGEAVPYARYGESMDSALAQIADVTKALEQGMTRKELQTALPPGAARNAVDCALLDLDARLEGRNLWQRSGGLLSADMLVAADGCGEAAGPLVTAYTLGLDSPGAMARDARDNASRPLLKLKLTGDGDLERVRAVRQAAPDCRLIVDANEGWTGAQYDSFVPELAGLGVSMIEQPFPAGQDSLLDGRPRPVAVCADESCHDSASLPGLQGRYDMVNLKLDKTGGLTEALITRQAAEKAGFGIMVGCMVATSLAMAPAFLLAQGADIVDLDGPLLLARDREGGFHFDGSVMHPCPGGLWGGG